MKPALAIAKRELRSSFNSPVAYVLIVGFLFLTSIWLYFVEGFFAVGQADLKGYFSLMPIVFAFLVPALTMRSWAEERRLGTYEVILTMPFTEADLVWGKFLSVFAVVMIALLFSLPVPLTAAWVGNFDAGLIASQYLCVILIAALAIALGEWVSSLAKNQVSAYIGASVLIILFAFVDRLGNFFRLSGIAASVVNWFSFIYHSDSLLKGLFDSRDLAYFLLVSAFFLYLTGWNIRRRKWS